MMTRRVYHGDGLQQVHRTVRIAHVGFEAKVDEQIAPLVLALWQAGMFTLSSCQNYDGKVWLAVPTDAALAHFRTICKPRGLEVHSVQMPEMWTLGPVHHLLFPPREIGPMLRLLKAYLKLARVRTIRIGRPVKLRK
jgi:hypothetical protein